MKRFWTDVDLAPVGEAFAVHLDGRPVRTPAREPLLLPSRNLAEAIRAEWSNVGDTMDPKAMPLTGLANAAIDHVSPDPDRFARDLAKYAEADLICYRAEAPSALIQRQQDLWDPLLAWARRRFDLDFVTTTGLMHVSQPDFTIERLRSALLSLGAFQLAGISPLVTIGGSLIAALAVQEGASDAAGAWLAVSLDERWQLEQWGNDSDAEVALNNRERDFLASARFLALLDG